MKHLNKNYSNSPLNKKIREIYRLKQIINNSNADKDFKHYMMRYCDKQINLCWERAYQGVKGYEI